MMEAKKTIWIDSDGYWNFNCGWDFENNCNCECTCPTVDIAIIQSGVLTSMVDDIRIKAGKLPMYPDFDGRDYDEDGWYNFYAVLEMGADNKVSVHLEAIVDSPTADDNELPYRILLSENEQLDAYSELDEQLRERFDTSCVGLLEEARKELEEYKEYKAISGRKVFA